LLKQVTQARDWYLVEWRCCSDQSICSVAFPVPADFGFDKLALQAHQLRLTTTNERSANLLHANGGVIHIDQYPFQDLQAAQLHFEQMKRLLTVRDPWPFQKLYLWRVVVRSRRSAFTIPPAKYSTKDGAILVQYPEHFWSNFQSNVDREDEKTIAEGRLEAFQTGLAEAELFAYELKHGLVPDGNSEGNPGYGPMDFNEWREWKRREFDRTGNLWHNHSGGLPPKEGNAA
jgi:hypothetical protein